MVRRIDLILPLFLILGPGFRATGQESADARSGFDDEMAELSAAMDDRGAAPAADSGEEGSGLAEMDAVLEAAAHSAPPPMEQADVTAGDAKIRALTVELSRKQALLDRANAEVARLRGALSEMLDASRSEQFEMHYNIGCICKTEGRYRKAEDHFLKALEMRPWDPDIHYNLGILYDDDIKDAGRARKHYERFLELAPNDESAPQVQEWLLSLAP